MAGIAERLMQRHSEQSGAGASTAGNASLSDVSQHSGAADAVDRLRAATRQRASLRLGSGERDAQRRSHTAAKRERPGADSADSSATTLGASAQPAAPVHAAAADGLREHDAAGAAA